MLSEEEQTQLGHRMFNRNIIDVIFKNHIVYDSKFKFLNQIPVINIQKQEEYIQTGDKVKILTVPVDIESNGEQIEGYFNKHCLKGDEVSHYFIFAFRKFSFFLK